MMPKHIIFLLIFYGFINFQLFSQGSGKYFINNYNRNNYNASISNFNSAQNSVGKMYFANFDGLIAFNGKDWSLLTLPDNSIALSIAIDDNDNIYVGSKQDFGYFNVNEEGKLIYKSLKHLIEKTDSSLSINSIVSITTKGNNAYFFSPTTIYRWDWKNLKIFRSNNDNKFKSKIIINRGNAYTIQENVGLVKIGLNNIEKVKGTKLLSNYSLRSLKLNKNGILIIGTEKGTFYSYQNDTIKYVTKIKSKKQKGSNFTSILGPKKFSEYLAFSTFTGPGLLLSKNNLIITDTINTKNGLQGSKVRNIYFDNADNLWASLYEGISHLELLSPWYLWNEDDGVKGTPWDIDKIDNNLVFSSTKGLYKLNNNILSKINNFKGHPWSIANIENDAILAGTRTGLFEIRNNKTRKILNFKLISLIQYLPKNNHIVVGHYGGISILNIKDTYFEKHFIEMKPFTYFDLYEINDIIWISVKELGILKIELSFNNSVKFNLFDKKNGLKDVNQISFIEKNGQLLFATNHGIYAYHEDAPDSLKFQPDYSIVKEVKQIIHAKKDANNNFYFVFSKDRNEYIEQYVVQKDKSYIRNYIPFKRLPNSEILDIYPDEDSVLWVASSEGLFKYDAKIPKDYTLPFNTVISQTSTTDDSVLFYGNYYDPADTSIVPSIIYEQPDSFKPVLEYKDNNITFEYSATFYEVPEKNEFSYILENNDEHWSHWSTENKKEYNNLPAGKYTFKVKSRNIYETIGRTASYSFTILPPWYQTAWAYFGFTMAGLFLFWFILLAYSYRVRLHRRNLKLIVADRTFEVMSQKKQLEKKQEEILSMNQQLSELNTSLEQKVRERTSRIVTTLKKLQKTNKELDTFVYKASHDLKNPLTQIIGLVTLAKREKLDKNAKEYLKRIESTSFNMEELLHKLTEVHETFNKNVIKEDIDFYDTLNELVTEFKNSEACQNTKLTFDTNKHTHITTDSFLLDIILKKLLENAIFYRKDETEPHEISIATSEKEDFFNIIIKDNGIGIEEEHRDKVYDMFFRGTEKSKGNGLGLYLVNQSVEKLHGTISFTSIKDEYTEFTVSIPSR